MKKALIGFAVVALALSTTFGATVFFSTSPTASGYSATNTAANNPVITDASGTLYIWVKVGTATVDSKITSASLDINPTAGVKFSNPQIINPLIVQDPEDPSANLNRWETTKPGTVTNGAVSDLTGFAVTAAAYGMKTSSIAPYPSDTFRDATGAYLFGSVDFVVTANSTASFATGFGTWANDKGADVQVQYGYGDAYVSGKTIGSTSGAADVTFTVPEPATMALLAVGGIAGLIRRRNA